MGGRSGQLAARRLVSAGPDAARAGGCNAPVGATAARTGATEANANMNANAACERQIAELAGALSREGGLKLWSVVVTVLGDLMHGGQSAVPGPVLTALTGRMGLQPQAMRVALHRLKRDGWVESRRTGRISAYRLSLEGQRQAEAVHDRVYGQEAAIDECVLVTLPPGLGVADMAMDHPPGAVGSDAFAIDTRTILCTDALTPPVGWLVVPFVDVRKPDWLVRDLKGAALDAEFEALRLRIASVGQGGGACDVDVCGRFALRTLVLHGWRRLILRSNRAAEVALGAGAAVVGCRMALCSALQRLPRPPGDALLHACQVEAAASGTAA